nr:hypothetical protein [Tanacetum cinerariifolium]
HKGKEIANPITPPSETASEEDNDPEQAQRDKDMQKNLALIAKYFKKIYKPTNNNLKTSLNSKNKNVDMTPRALTARNMDILPRSLESRKGLRTPRTTRRRCCYASKLSKEVPTADSGTDSEPVEQVAFCPGLRFVLDYVFSSTAFCLFEDHLLCFAKDKLCQTQNCTAFCLRPNGEALRKCILSGPYKPTTILVQVVKATDDSPAVPEHTTVETPMNMSPENKAYFLAEKEAIHLILTGIRDEIYSTVDACQTAHEIKFISHDGETMESYYTRFYKLMNEMIKNNLTIICTITKILNSNQISHNYQTQRQKIAKPITPISKIAFEEDIDPKQAQRDKDMQKNLALIAKYFKKIYKPTNNNLRTSSNSRNKNVDMTPRKLKRVKDSAYHKEKMLLCKQAEQGVPFQVEQYDWLADTDEEVDEEELEEHYSYMAKIQEVPIADLGTDSEPVEQVQNDAGYNVFANHLQHSKQSESISNTCLVETNDSNVIPDSPYMCEYDIQNKQNDVESDDEHVALANLISNLKLDVDENKKIQKQLKKEKITLAQELKECKTILAETSKSLGSLLVFGIVAWLHFRPSRLSLRSIRHLMTVPLTMPNLNVS